MKAKMVSVKVFEVFSPDGTSLGLFKVKDQWNGMTELHALSNGAVLIVDGAAASNGAINGVFDEIFGDILGRSRAEFEVVKVAPSLAVQLQSGDVP
jgi:hypothetical protein